VADQIHGPPHQPPACGAALERRRGATATGTATNAALPTD
jgi:hypothetical protein